MVLLNRDDQAGFRLDSTYTHKSHGNLSTAATITNRTDFVNKYTAQLQISSHNFPETSTTSEVCVGVVKASGVQKKKSIPTFCRSDESGKYGGSSATVF